MQAKAHSQRYLAVIGNAGDIGAWSGIPYHFYEAGKAVGFFQGALNLQVERTRQARRFWNARQLLLGRGLGGYQYSESFLHRVFGNVTAQVEGAEIISHFQLFPPVAKVRAHRLTPSFYIDLPLRRLFEDYRIKDTIGKRIAADAIRRERDGYLGAKYVVCMSSWAARSVREEYGIPSAQVRNILPGANMDESIVAPLTATLDQEPIELDFRPERPFRLGFVGKDYRRKGLLRLLAAARILNSRGYPVEVVVIGHIPEEAQRDPLVRWLGFIDKRTDLARFSSAVKSVDLGCLLSSAEGLGISTLEFLRMGVPVLGTDVGGITDCVPAGAGLLVAPLASDEELASLLQGLLDNPDKYSALRLEARRLRSHFTWRRTVAEFEALWRLPRASGDTSPHEPAQVN